MKKYLSDSRIPNFLAQHGLLLLSFGLPLVVWQIWIATSSCLAADTHSSYIHAVLCRLADQALPVARLAVWQMLSAWLIFPLVEEFVFRQHLLMYLTERFEKLAGGMHISPVWAANLTCSVLFSLCHAPLHGWWVALVVFIPSVVLGFVYLRYRSLLLNTGLHAWWNVLYAFAFLKPFG